MKQALFSLLYKKKDMERLLCFDKMQTDFEVWTTQQWRAAIF